MPDGQGVQDSAMVGKVTADSRARGRVSGYRFFFSSAATPLAPPVAAALQLRGGRGGLCPGWGADAGHHAKRGQHGGQETVEAHVDSFKKTACADEGILASATEVALKPTAYLLH